MFPPSRMRRSASHLAFLGLLAVMASLAVSSPAFAQLTGGERIYFDKGGCNQCHGSQGNGVGDDAREHGANLRETSLDKELLVMIISCGIPGTNMPYFDKFSYTDDRCYGMTEADVGTDKPQTPIASFLAKRDIEVVAQYILDTFAGKGSASSSASKKVAVPPPSH